MPANYDPRRLDALLQRLFDEMLAEHDSEELNAILSGSAAARDHYRKSLRIHAALIRHRQPGSVVPMAPAPRDRRFWRVAAGLAAAGALLAALVFTRAPVARLSGTTAAVWAEKIPPTTLDHPLDLVAGFAEITYRNGVRVILEGPCRFQVDSAMSMNVGHGRATVKVPHRIHGFHLDTPAGRITDLGTEFGVAVGSGVEGPVILTEVFDGEIEIPAEDASRRRLLSGDSLAIVGETGGTKLVSSMGDYRVDLGDSARRLPGKSASPRPVGNLALGKPVTSPAHYSMPHGSHFPAATLTDGRLNDSGSPGDWSFWLAPDGEDGEFTVDLLEARDIGRIELQNTRNRTHGDRGMREFSVRVSEDGRTFSQVLQAELRRIPELPSPGVDFPIESFSFPPVRARFVKVVGLSHFRCPTRPPDHSNHGGGLNEIRIFAP